MSDMKANGLSSIKVPKKATLGGSTRPRRPIPNPSLPSSPSSTTLGSQEEIALKKSSVVEGVKSPENGFFQGFLEKTRGILNSPSHVHDQPEPAPAELSEEQAKALVKPKAKKSDGVDGVLSEKTSVAVDEKSLADTVSENAPVSRSTAQVRPTVKRRTSPAVLGEVKMQRVVISQRNQSARSNGLSVSSFNTNSTPSNGGNRIMGLAREKILKVGGLIPMVKKFDLGASA